MAEHISVPAQQPATQAATPAALVAKPEFGNPQLDFYYNALAGSLPIQRKLAIGTVNDPMEHEADAMADKIMRMPENSFNFARSETDTIQRKCNHCEEEENDGIAQRKPLISFIQKKENNKNSGTADNAITNQINATKGGGTNMDTQTQSFMENRFGTSFQDVRIHTGGYASSLSQQLNAKAFTVGKDVYFNQNNYAPNTSEGKHLLAHELTHTVQQSGGTVVRRSLDTLSQPVRDRIVYWNVRLWGDNDDDPLRKEALNDYFKIAAPNSSEGAVGTHVIDATTSTVVKESKTYSIARGLQSIPGYIVHKYKMPLNSYTNAKMDLTAFGGKSGIFRFIYVNTSVEKDAETNPKPEFHIDFLSPLPTAAAATTNRPSTISIGSQTFTALGTWPDAMYDDLIVALNLLPQAVRTKINKQQFKYRSNFSRTATESSEDGHVSLNSDATQTQDIDVFKSTTQSAINTYGTYSRTVYTILHEIGHVLDFEPIREAFAAGGKKDADSLSGSFRFESKKKDFVEDQTNKTDFSTAVGKSNAITPYAGTDRKESFGEYFAMYVVDRAALQMLRPKVYAYFLNLYP